MVLKVSNFIWNMKFCQNKGYSFQASVAHNLPALIIILLSFGNTTEDLVNEFSCIRIGSIISIILNKTET